MSKKWTDYDKIRKRKIYNQGEYSLLRVNAFCLAEFEACDTKWGLSFYGTPVTHDNKFVWIKNGAENVL